MMTQLRPTLLQHRQRGFASIAAVVFVILFVFFILQQSLRMLGDKSIDSLQYLNSINALYIADSGAERATGIISNLVAGGTSTTTACDSAKLDNNGSATAIAFPGGGSFAYATPTTPAGPAGTCDVRVTGTFKNANRTVQARINVASELGTAGFGHDISMQLNNPNDVAGVGVFNLAWRRQGSTGHSTAGGQATASACTLPSCGLQWNIESSSGQPSVGSMGTAVGIAAQASVTVAQTLSTDRNYVEVGMVMPGLATQPLVKGSFADKKRTGNTANNTVTTGDTPSGEANASSWCYAADTLVFGISGRGNDDVTGAYSSVVFNSAGTPAQPVPLTYVAHYPNTDGSTPDVFGDVFSEIWWTYNPYVRFSGASSVGTTVTVSTPQTLKAGTILKVFSGTGVFAGNTKVVANTTAQTTFQVTPAPTTPLVNATLCGGICALFNNPSSAASSTTFAVTRTSPVAQQWAGGFTCLSGVDPTKVRPVTRSSARISQWHELISDY